MDSNKLKEVLLALVPALSLGRDGFLVFKPKMVVYSSEEVLASVPFATGLNCTVDAKAIIELVRRLPRGEVELIDKGGSLVLKGERFKAEFRKLDANQDVILDEVLEEISTGGTEDVEGLKDALALCASLASSVTNSSILQCVHFNGTIVEASNNYEVLLYQLSKSMPDFCILGRHAQVIAKLNPVKYKLSDAWFHVMDEKGVVYSARVIKGGYPDTTPIQELPNPKRIYLENPVEILQVFDRAKIFIDNELDHPYVELVLRKSSVEVLCKSMKGSYQEVVDGGCPDIEGNEGWKIALVPNLAKHLLSSSTKFYVSENRDKLKVCTDSLQYIMSLVEVD